MTWFKDYIFALCGFGAYSYSLAHKPNSHLLLPHSFLCSAIVRPTPSTPLLYPLSQTLTEAVFAVTSLTLMDSGACKNLCDKIKDSCLRSSQKLDERFIIVGANKDVSKLPDAADCKGPLVPITPDADRENGDYPIDLQSPLTVMKKPFNLSDIDSNCNENGCKVAFVDDSSPKTPKDGVFDPFAPGPENMAHAPQCKKYHDDLRSCVARRLNFIPSLDTDGHKRSGYDEESLSDQEMFESVYENLLEVILSTQAEGILAEISDAAYDSDDCKTPPSALRLNGIADTCPGAPMKPGNKPRIIHVGLRRKLEF